MSRSSRSLLFSYYLVCFVRVLGKETGTGADNCPGTPTRGGGRPHRMPCRPKWSAQPYIDGTLLCALCLF